MLIKILSSLIEKILAANSGIRKELATYHGKVIRIELASFSLNIQIKLDGYFDLVSNEQGSDVIIKLPLNISQYLAEFDKLTLARQIQISGEKELGLNFLNLISNLQFNFLYGKYVALDQMLLMASKLLDILKDSIQSIANKFSVSLVEYLQFESRDLVYAREMDAFCNEVDELSSKVERLNAKLASYSNQTINHNV